MHYERISCGWSKRLKPNETSRILICTACDQRRNEISGLIGHGVSQFDLDQCAMEALSLDPDEVAHIEPLAVFRRCRRREDIFSFSMHMR